jgi:methyl-accepting chemotaxis protein
LVIGPRLSTRIGVLLAAASALLLVLGVLGIHGSHEGRETLRAAHGDLRSSVARLTEIQRLIFENRMALAGSLLTTDPVARVAAWNAVAVNKETIDRAMDLMLGERCPADEAAATERVAATRGRFVAEGIRPAAAAIREGRLEDANRIVADRMHSLYADVERNIGQLAELKLRRSQGALEGAADRLGLIRAALAVVLGLGLLGLTLVGVRLMRRVRTGIDEALVATRAMVDGDIESRIEANGADEITELLHALKELQSRLGRVVGEVCGLGRSLGATAAQVLDRGRELLEQAQRQAEGIHETAAGIGEVAASMQHGSHEVQRAEELATEAVSAAGEGVAAVARVVATMQSTQHGVREIVGVADVIDDIAFQTNLLAMNAGVEASRAGESGSGFTVVAEEVAGLARRAANAASQIKALVAQCAGTVEQGMRLVEDAGRSVTGSVARVRAASDLLGGVTQLGEAQTKRIRSVEVVVADLDTLAQRNAAMAERLAAAARDLGARCTQVGSAVHGLDRGQR